jgi:flavin-dependent dehydrogenase
VLPLPSKKMKTVDAIVIGGGPSGSACASILVKAGAQVLVLDSATFPRVKLCAGWVSPGIWDILELQPREYPLGLWEWSKGSIHFAGRSYTLPSKGFFIRRHEFDEFLLRRSNAPVVEGHHVKTIERDGDGTWVVDRQFRSKYLVGAGGSHCPVARALFPKRANPPCGTQEIEFEADPAEIGACRLGEDGEPQILLHDDLKGYSWNVPKSGWLNIGTGTTVAREVLPAWRVARAFFEGNGPNGNVPVSARPMLDKMKGHGYSGFSPKHFASCQRDGAFLVGDALGLAHPTTGEGILPAVLSGRLCGAAIADGVPESYGERLANHPTMTDYRFLFSARALAGKLFGGNGEKRARRSGLYSRLVVKIFGALFSGRPLPGARIIAQMMKVRRLVERSPGRWAGA